MTRCYLGLGSNLHSPLRQLRRAVDSIRKLPRTALVHVSKIYVSHPLGVHSQPNYFNLVVAIETSLPAIQLLRLCQAIEHKQHRVHKQHWGARTLDIDLLLYDKKTINTQTLTIPHPQMLKRDFVLVPLLDIAPKACLPDNQLIADYLTNCDRYLV